MPRENWLIVGISGATCSGKTTVAKELHSLFSNSVLLQQDDYFYDEKSEKHTKIAEFNHINFEILSSIDMAAFKNQIRLVIESSNSSTGATGPSQGKPTEVEAKFTEKYCSTEIAPSAYCIISKFQKLQFVPNILFIEGFLIFNDDQLQDLCDLKFYFTMSKGLCWERRKNRVYQPPDVPGYFEKYVWPSYLVHYEEVLRKSSNVVYIDGADSIENNFRSILHKILDFLL
ncbi:hypothetical protein RUM43_010281 [Polyplax serrata]|uniref:Phosphoribulokinase/uridine kinase domain-containing protein n=1 Tax=Polyplax serrata TaxID=468196 RepID=A0AAN8P3W5_POLSC